MSTIKQYKTPIIGVIIGTLLGLVAGLLLGHVMPWRPTSKLFQNAALVAPPGKKFKTPVYHDFINQNGQKVSSADFRHKVQVVTFLFPYCTSICPILASRMRNLEILLRKNEINQYVQLISFNVDPENTGPKQMRAFMREFGADPNDPGWLFLTASPAAISQVVRNGFHANYQKISLTAENRAFALQRKQGEFNYMPDMLNGLAEQAKPNFDITHNSSVILVGTDGYVRYIIGNGNTVSARILFNHIVRMLQIKKGA